MDTHPHTLVMRNTIDGIILLNIKYFTHIAAFLKSKCLRQSLTVYHLSWEVNSNRLEIPIRGKISLRCKVTSLSAFTWVKAKWNSFRCKFQVKFQMPTAKLRRMNCATPLLESNQINTVRNKISSLRNYQVTGKRVL